MSRGFAVGALMIWEILWIPIFEKLRPTYSFSSGRLLAGGSVLFVSLNVFSLTLQVRTIPPPPQAELSVPGLSPYADAPSPPPQPKDEIPSHCTQVRWFPQTPIAPGRGYVSDLSTPLHRRCCRLTSSVRRHAPEESSEPGRVSSRVTPAHAVRGLRRKMPSCKPVYRSQPAPLHHARPPSALTPCGQHPCLGEFVFSPSTLCSLFFLHLYDQLKTN